ncbi:MAG: type III-A CRISPR-associated RAMP protein Csm5, partial [Candidatus Muiribacteriaceae bacterium]
MRPVKVRLKTLSPLSIKSGDQKHYFEFFAGERNVFFLNQKEFMSVLQNSKIDRQYIDLLSNAVFNNKKSENFSVKNMLGQLDCLLDEEKDRDLLDEVSHYVLTRNNKKVGKTIETLIRDINYRPYIPGSSIKGAIRTAFYAEIFSRKIETGEKYYRVQWQRENHRGRIISCNTHNKLVNDMFIKNEITVREKYDAKYDFLKFIQISDAKLVGNDPSELMNFRVYGMKSKGGVPEFDQEVIQAGSEFEFTIKIDTERYNIWLKNMTGRYNNNNI